LSTEGGRKEKKPLTSSVRGEGSLTARTETEKDFDAETQEKTETGTQLLKGEKETPSGGCQKKRGSTVILVKKSEKGFRRATAYREKPVSGGPFWGRVHGFDSKHAGANVPLSRNGERGKKTRIKYRLKGHLHFQQKEGLARRGLIHDHQNAHPPPPPKKTAKTSIVSRGGVAVHQGVVEGKKKRLRGIGRIRPFLGAVKRRSRKN